MNKILFFGVLAEIVDKHKLEDKNFSDTDSLDEFVRVLTPEIKDYTYRIAVNFELINSNTILKDGDEIAFLPPFAGG